MKELPILFKTEMVQALLAGRKTMIRRIIKQKSNVCMFCGCTDNNCKVCIERTGEPCYWINDEKTICSACAEDKSTNKAKYQIGDLLWVRETWMQNPNIEIFPEEPMRYKASASKQYVEEWAGYWKPSIYMPKEAARIWLRVINVKCERLQDITADDAVKEGIKKIEGLGWKHYSAKSHFTKQELKDACPFLKSPILSFLSLWESINGKESLERNPWIFAYEFELVSISGKEAICM